MNEGSSVGKDEGEENEVWGMVATKGAGVGRKGGV